MANVIPAAPVHAMPVVVAGHTGPTGPPGPSAMLMATTTSIDALLTTIADLAARVEALEDELAKR
jgi:hypothetical protein